MDELTGLVAVVTGAASGIGAATSARLHAAGATVIGFDRDPAGPDNIQVDVVDDAAVNAAADEVLSRHGKVDVLVNNAAIGAVGAVGENSIAEWQRVLDVNVLGIVRVTTALLDGLRASSTGASIVNTCSIAATAGLPRRAAYSASKGAVLALTLAMAADFVSEGIRVNCVTPGTADTPWVRRLLAASDDPNQELERLRARQPMGRLVTAEEVAHAICYLASPAAASTTGTVLPVDGGMAGLRLPPASR